MTQEIEIDYDQVEAVAKIWGTLAECAAVLKVSENTIKRRLANDQRFKEAWERGQELCKLSLRRTLFNQSKGFGPQAVTAAIHLSKHILGWTEKSLVEHTGTIQHELTPTQNATDLLTSGFDPRCLSTQEAIELQDLCEALDEAGSLRALGPEKRGRILELLDRGAGTNVIEGEFIEVKPSLPAPEEQKDLKDADSAG